ncbi:Vps54-domain-containing protein [Neoconidiobolus thromboides FSU 785]|nr:Vps54-domain-containing protein [Neoconidiobolus thromboides FSU 785]
MTHQSLSSTLKINTGDNTSKEINVFLFEDLFKEREEAAPQSPTIMNKKKSLPQYVPFNITMLRKKHFISEVNKNANLNTRQKFESPAVPKTFIRKIKPSDFDPYLSRITSSFNQHQHSASFNLPVLPEVENAAEIAVSYQENDLPDLSQLSETFFDTEFSLENARTFNLLCSMARDEEVVESELNLVTSTKLQDKLSLNLDKVEAHLVHEISKRSDGFFSALNKLKGLELETEEAIEGFQRLRSALDDIKQQQAKDSIKVLQLRQRKENLFKLDQCFALLNKIYATQPAIKALLDEKDSLGALKLILGIEDELGFKGGKSSPVSWQKYIEDNETSPKLKNVLFKELNPSKGEQGKKEEFGLAQLKCLKNFWSFLDISKAQAIVQMEEYFATLILNFCKRTGNQTFNFKKELDHLLGGDEGEEELNLVKGQLNQAELEQLKASLKPLLRGLKISNHLPAAIASTSTKLIELLQQQIFDEIIGFFQNNNITAFKNIPFDTSDWEESSFGQELIKIDYDDYFKILILSFSIFIQQIKQIKKLESIIEDQVDSFKKELIKEKELEDFKLFKQEWIKEMQSLSFQVSEKIQLISNQLISLRIKANEYIHPNLFYKVYFLSWRLITHMETITGKTNSLLRTSIFTSAKLFLNIYHQENLKAITNSIEKDNWKPVPIDINNQRSVDLIQFSLHNEFNHPNLNYDTSFLNEEQNVTKNKSQHTTDKIMIAAIDYYATESGLCLLSYLQDYLKASINMPAISQELVNRIVSILDHYNRGTYRAVLGAGATKTAGMAKISAKHICLASQTLGLFVGLLPSLRRSLELSLGPQRALLVMQLDRIASDMAEHQNQLHSKLVAILSDNANNYLQQMEKITFDQCPADEGQVNPYMRKLVQDVQALHKIMIKFLLPRDIQKIITQVNLEYATSLEQKIEKLKIKTPLGKRNLLRDVQYLIKGLSLLPTQISNLHHLEVVVNDLKL